MTFSANLLSSECTPVIRAAWADPLLCVGFLPCSYPLTVLFISLNSGLGLSFKVSIQVIQNVLNWSTTSLNPCGTLHPPTTHSAKALSIVRAGTSLPLAYVMEEKLPKPQRSGADQRKRSRKQRVVTPGFVSV